MYDTVVLPVYMPPPPPPVYTPPPPLTLTLNLARCRLCQALLEYGKEQGHRDWHLANGLHGTGCALIASMNAQRGNNTLMNLDACSCGLENDN